MKNKFSLRAFVGATAGVTICFLITLVAYSLITWHAPWNMDGFTVAVILAGTGYGISVKQAYDWVKQKEAE